MLKSDFLSCYESQFMDELNKRGLIRNKDYIYGYPFKYPTRIADFVFPSKNLIVELDGPHHVKQVYYKDKWKDALALKQGWDTVRFNMEEMKDMVCCVNKILDLLK
jgi:very-short-patch-repair endonuclease